MEEGQEGEVEEGIGHELVDDGGGRFTTSTAQQWRIRVQKGGHERSEGGGGKRQMRERGGVVVGRGRGRVE